MASTPCLALDEPLAGRFAALAGGRRRVVVVGITFTFLFFLKGKLSGLRGLRVRVTTTRSVDAGGYAVTRLREVPNARSALRAGLRSRVRAHAFGEARNGVTA